MNTHNRAERAPTCVLVTIKYVPTGTAARAVGIARRTLLQWVTDGKVEPDFRTAGGHMRWDVDRLRGELRARFGGRGGPE